MWPFTNRPDTSQVADDRLEAILEALRALQRPTTPDPTLASRVEALERSRPIWEAEMEALVSKAQNEHRNAKAAEERARSKLKRAESLGGDEDSDEALQAWIEEMARRNGEVSGQEGVQPVPEILGRHASKQAAKLRKWGGLYE